MITLFEKFESILESSIVGDLVELKMIPDYATHIPYKDTDNLYAKIVKIEDKTYRSPYSGDHADPVIIEFELTNGQKIWGYKYLIRKKLNDKQIEDYYVKVDAQKYNL
jgi:hypothetical protein